MEDLSQDSKQQILYYILKTTLLYRQPPRSQTSSQAFCQNVTQQKDSKVNLSERAPSMDPLAGDMPAYVTMETEFTKNPACYDIQKEMVSRTIADLERFEREKSDYERQNVSMNTGDFIFEVTENPAYNVDWPPNEYPGKYPALSPYDLMGIDGPFTPEKPSTGINNVAIGQSATILFEEQIASRTETDSELSWFVDERTESNSQIINKLYDRIVLEYFCYMDLESETVDVEKFLDDKVSERVEKKTDILFEKSRDNIDQLETEKIMEPVTPTLSEILAPKTTAFNTEGNIQITPETFTTSETRFLIRFHTNGKPSELAFADDEKTAIAIINSLVVSEIKQLEKPGVLKVFRRDMHDGREVHICTQALGYLVNGAITKKLIIDCVEVPRIYFRSSN